MCLFRRGAIVFLDGPLGPLGPPEPGPGPVPEPGCVSPRGQVRERVFQIMPEIVDRLESDADAHQVAGHLVAGAGGAGVGHPGRMLNEAFHRAEALGQCENAGPRAQLDGGVFPTVHGETDHAAEGPHLRPGDLVTRMVWKRRMMHLLDRRVTAQELDYGQSIDAVPFHPYAQRLDPTLHQAAVEGAGYGAGRILKEPQSSRDLLVAGRGEASDDVGVTTEVLGGRVHDDVRSQAERLLYPRRGKGVVNDDESSPTVRRGGDGGEVDEGEEGLRR